LGEITLFDYFPEAKLICEQFPTLADTLENFTASGFIFETILPIVQQTCSSLRELAVRTRLRTDTTLILLTEEEFWRRQTALELQQLARQNRLGYRHARLVGLTKGRLKGLTAI
jgi:hypothetical protein